mmetsp:Transcript_15032/g.26131  ORF Transcript_15032/g.26131 Transcript_15032/m.26131 type:complete len:268 (+) Transcript_15032:56-859(+)|eukprot:CAMPEP_0119103804 /NCGR_PEP_ID=MMETSP1180-20130426/2177_1 /TAXON_ID=3052 ORGANISM="Chlamydomonas cf sp, Strain CCMP681" /NCGR_SAMPLE_ID=MMETSP1180 /ASSEMBLY_ACC=CAM_ASM_000741 /LENGTH=267 /DNA_ID=CAMNT_0007088399 /DNA_START=39 /DNA_END=842 /DNA_ORIENTATION=-
MAVLARLNSKSQQGTTDEDIRTATQRFDLEIVRILNLAGRGLSSVAGSGLNSCVNLTDLNLSDNTISKIEGLDALLGLKKLQLAGNRITRVENLGHLTKLEWLSLQGNQLDRIHCVDLQLLSTLPTLKTLYLQDLGRTRQNGCCKQPNYKAAVLAILPGLANLDGERCPGACTYAETAEQMEAAIASPPSPRQVPALEIAPWLTEGQLEQAQAVTAVLEDAALHAAKDKLAKAAESFAQMMDALAQEVAKATSTVHQAPVPAAPPSS